MPINPPQTLNPQTLTLNRKPYTLNHKPSTLNPYLSTLNRRLKTLKTIPYNSAVVTAELIDSKP
jgi:hypothetical protein